MGLSVWQIAVVVILVVLLFGSGKMVCVGAREVNNIKDAVRNIKEELSTAGLMRT